jgi:WhiB family redox-sensing transcriptional regulator
LCAQTDPEVFFPEKGGSVREAKAVCAGCPVRTPCLEYALAHDERFGVWGGLSERERRRLTSAARRQLASQPAARRAGALAARRAAPGRPDEVVVARLMAGHPVPDSSRLEVAQAAIGLHRAGQGTPRIAAALGVHARQVERWVTRHRAGQPLCRQQPGAPQRRAARAGMA